MRIFGFVRTEARSLRSRTNMRSSCTPSCDSMMTTTDKIEMVLHPSQFLVEAGKMLVEMIDQIDVDQINVVDVTASSKFPVLPFLL